MFYLNFKIVFHFLFFSISIDGISIEELCPANSEGTSENRSKAKHLLRGSTFGSPTQKVPANRYVNGAHLSEFTGASGTTGSLGASTSTDDASASTATTTSSDNDDNIPDNCMWPNALQVCSHSSFIHNDIVVQFTR